MARSGSLPWLILAAVLCTLLAVFLEGAFMAPTMDAFMGTEVWQTNHNSYAYDGKRMVGNFVAHLVTLFTLGIWTGVLIAGRRAL